MSFPCFQLCFMTLCRNCCGNLKLEAYHTHTDTQIHANTVVYVCMLHVYAFTYAIICPGLLHPLDPIVLWCTSGFKRLHSKETFNTCLISLIMNVKGWTRKGQKHLAKAQPGKELEYPFQKINSDRCRSNSLKHFGSAVCQTYQTTKYCMGSSNLQCKCKCKWFI